jgi:hypothetical protein
MKQNSKQCESSLAQKNKAEALMFKQIKPTLPFPSNVKNHEAGT